MTATAFHSISIILIIIGFAALAVMVVGRNWDINVLVIIGWATFVFGTVFGILGIISYTSYKSYSENSIYAEYIPEQMGYCDWLTSQWEVQEIECPNCGTKVSLEYTYCPECNYFLKEGYICPECGGKTQPTDIHCPWCGADL